MIHLTVNGTNYTTEKKTLKQLLDEMGIVSERVAVEVNLRVIRKAEFAGHALTDGDVVEIVNFVGGGADAVRTKQRGQEDA